MPSPINIFENKSPDQAWRIVRREIVARKVDAYRHAGHFLTYSGPDIVVSPAADPFLPFPPRISNADRAANEVDTLNRASIKSNWFDGTPIGTWLFKENNLYEGLSAYYRGVGVVDRAAQRAGVDYVMSRVSRSYIKQAYGYAGTAVCGASHRRIFYRYELPASVSNVKILQINSLPREMVREFYAINKDEAFQLICWAELLLSKERMDADPSRNNKQDFEQRRYYLNEERKLMQSKLTAAKVKPLTKRGIEKREEKRYQILSKHRTAILDHTLKDILMEIEPLCPMKVTIPVRKDVSHSL